MKITIEIECDDENISLKDIDWFIVEGGSSKETIQNNSDEQEAKSFSYYFKVKDGSLTNEIANQDVKKSSTVSLPQPPPPPPPPPPPSLLSATTLNCKTNKLPNQKTKKKKVSNPPTVITLDDIKNVKLKKRTTEVKTTNK